MRGSPKAYSLSRVVIRANLKWHCKQRIIVIRQVQNESDVVGVPQE